MSEEGPKNRKERRQAAKESGKPIEPPTQTPKFKLEQPDRSGPKEATLLDLYEQKKSLLEHGQPFDNKHQDGQVRDEVTSFRIKLNYARFLRHWLNEWLHMQLLTTMHNCFSEGSLGLYHRIIQA